MPLAFQDGKYIDKAELKLHPADFGFARGIGVFEFTRAYGGKLFRLADHIERFLAGANVFGIACPLSVQQLTEISQRLVATNGFAHSGVKFYLTAGECGTWQGVGFGGCSSFTPHFVAFEEEVFPQHPDYPKGQAVHEQGIALKSLAFARQYPLVKSINYSPGFVAARQYVADGWDEVLFTSNGKITETTMSNIFMVIDGVLCTPSDGMLLGVTRKVVLELAAKLGIPTAVRDITLKELDYTSEVFITGTFSEMLSVRKIDGYEFKTTTNGKIFTQLRRALSTAIAGLTA